LSGSVCHFRPFGYPVVVGAGKLPQIGENMGKAILGEQAMRMANVKQDVQEDE
jgi:Sec-independent protein translocase protein TatA